MFSEDPTVFSFYLENLLLLDAPCQLWFRETEQKFYLAGGIQTQYLKLFTTLAVTIGHGNKNFSLI